MLVAKALCPVGFVTVRRAKVHDFRRSRAAVYQLAQPCDDRQSQKGQGGRRGAGWRGLAFWAQERRTVSKERPGIGDPWRYVVQC